MNTIRYIFTEYEHWKNNWDDLCKRCGQCCYTRFSSNGEVIINYSAPCENLDENTNLCRVFENRFRECNHCGRVNLAQVLFNPLMPPECAYVKTFRVWQHDQ